MFRIILGAAASIHTGFSIRSYKRRISFVWTAIKYKPEIQAFLQRLGVACQGSYAGNIAHMLGVIEWPYVHNQWDVTTKLDKIVRHYEILRELSSKLVSFTSEQVVELVDLSAISDGVKVVIDKPQWFIREGELVINLFQNDLRVASMAFVIGEQDGIRSIFIGAVQGIHSGVSSEKSLEIYKILTKDFEGLRPRSLLLEILKMQAKKLRINSIFAIAEEHRHHRHAYFGRGEDAKFKNNYNPIWEEHDGILNNTLGFYEIPAGLAIKDISEIPSRKRGQYKRRYEIIRAIDEKMTNCDLN